MVEMIICGAGRVGFNLARYLSRQDNLITVIDHDPDLIARINERLDVKALCGHACAPEVLREAGAESAHMLIAVTQSDEVNMVSCEVAHALFGVETKIARLRNRSYLDSRWEKLFSPAHLNIDFVISPEEEVAKNIARTLSVPGAIDLVPLADERLQLIAMRCTAQTPLVNTPLKNFTQLFPTLDIHVVGMMREDRQWVPTPNDILQEGDKIYFVIPTASVETMLPAFGYEDERSSRILILGGGNIGLRLAQLLEKASNTPQMTIVERDEARAAFVAQVLEETIVLCGDGLDKEVLQEANVESTHTVISVTADDRVNGLAALLAKRLNAQRALALINAGSFEPLVSSLGVDAIINPRKVTVSKILHYINRKKLRAIYSLGTQWGEIMEIGVEEGSSFVGLKGDDIESPKGIALAALVRGDETYLHASHLTVEAGDTLVIMVAPDARGKLEKFLSTL